MIYNNEGGWWPDRARSSAATRAFSFARQHIDAFELARVDKGEQGRGFRRRALDPARDGAMNDQLRRDEYVVMQRRFQSIMVALLAIEQLTGATVAGQAALGSNAENSVSKDLLAFQNQVAAADDAVK